MDIEVLDINKLSEYKYNAKIHTEEQIEQIIKSIQEFGFNDPIAIDENNQIIEGHGRLYALKKLGFEKVQCIRLKHLSEEKKKAYILAHNKLTLNTGFDTSILNLELESIQDIDMSFYGFKVDLPAIEMEAEEDDFEVELKEETDIKAGDIFQLGRHRLMCGDSSKIEDVQKLMSGNEATLFLTDPPYNVSYSGKTKEALTIQNDKMSNDNFREFLNQCFYNAGKVLKPGGVFYIWHSDSEGYNFRGACFDIGWQIRQCLIWNKNSLVLGRQDYHWKHEPCLYGWKKGAAHLWKNDRKQTTILDFDRPTKNIEHPTMKPVKLFDYQIKNSTNQKEIVLDLFGGSGTTLIACEQNNRIAHLMELDEKYCDVIIRRFESLTHQKAIKIA